MAPSSNWFVAPDGGPRADGAREDPFHDPWLAFRRAEPGDTIHIAAGTYYGRYDRSSWIIDCPNLTVLGGYNSDFTARIPWKTPSIFACLPGYEYVRENNLIAGRDDHSGLTLDGVFFDSAGRNNYGAKPGDGISWYSSMDGPIASFNRENVTIRNCVFSNSATGGVELSGAGSRFENNMLLNMIGSAMLDLRSSSQLIAQPIVALRNTLCFMHDTGEPAGKGGDRSIGIRVNCPAALEDNLFLSCGNSAIETFLDPARIAIDRNVFFLTPHDVVDCRATGNTGEFTEQNLEEMEDLGFKSCAGNSVQDPAVSGLDPAWLDTYSRHLLTHYAKPPRGAANAVRVAAGLPPLTPADLEKDDQEGALAPCLSIADALAFRAQHGARPVELPVEIAAVETIPVFTYQRIEWPMLLAPDAALAGTRVELRAGLGSEQNSYLLADASPETHMGIRIYQPGSDDDSLFVLIRRHSFSVRQYRESVISNRGIEVETTYYLRGILRTDLSGSRQKSTIVVESFAPAPAYGPAQPVRPLGRDWFVRAGSSGGDGTREKPFRDPFQALEKAEGGDSIHVAAGDYFGKLRCGRWNISIRYLALLGGYNADFTARDPWTNLTRFLLHEDERAKGRPAGTILFSEENSDGLIVDGFIFDGATWNTYKDGSLDCATSPLAPLISLKGLNSAVTVRNCLFANGSDGAAIISCPFAVFENNIVVNTSGDGVVIRGNGPGPAMIRNNTILFACDPTPRAGDGKSSSGGTLLQLNGRAAMNIESNIFAFADNFGVRVAAPQPNVSLYKNIFAANLYNHLTDTSYLWADGSNWNRRVVADSAFAGVEGNQLQLPVLPVDPAFADVALPRLFNLPSRISKEEWKSITSAVGSSATPPPEEKTAVPQPATPPPSKTSSSIDDILGRFSRTEAKLQQATAKPATAPLYCPKFDSTRALALALNASDAGAGAHRQNLTASFSAAQAAKPQLQYRPVSAADIDAILASLDNQPIELEISDLRESSSNPSLFPSGTSKNDYTAFSVSATQSDTRTRLAIVVKDDTAASRQMRRIAPSDKLKVKGIAHLTSGLSILVDNIEIAGS